MASSRFPLQPMDDAQVVMSQRQTGLEPNQRAVFGDGLVEFPLVFQCGAQVKAAAEFVGLEPDSLAKFGDGLVEVARSQQQGEAEGQNGPLASWGLF